MQGLRQRRDEVKQRGTLACAGFAPSGWMFCEGQIMPISENETLFNLIGTTYGGDGRVARIPHDLFGRPMPSFAVRSFPVRARYGLIWIFPGDPDLSQERNIPDIPELEGPDRWACGTRRRRSVAVRLDPSITAISPTIGHFR